jgi:hypothetical protein
MMTQQPKNNTVTPIATAPNMDRSSRPKQKNLATTETALRGDPTWQDFDAEGFEGLAPKHGATVHESVRGSVCQTQWQERDITYPEGFNRRIQYTEREMRQCSNSRED